MDNSSRGLLIWTGGLFAALILTALLVHTGKERRKAYHEGEAQTQTEVIRGSWEQLANRTIERKIGEMGGSDTYYFIENTVIDTAWTVPTDRQTAEYRTLRNKATALLSTLSYMTEHGDTTGEQYHRIHDQIIVTDSLTTIASKEIRKPYGWRLRQTCLLEGRKLRIVYDIDSTGTDIQEVYSHNAWMKACPDSTALQEKLKTQINTKK